VLGVALFEDGGVGFCDDGPGTKAPADCSGGAFVVGLTWWPSPVTAVVPYSLFSVIADWAAERSTMALLPA
jgi:hypothetical protein